MYWRILVTAVAAMLLAEPAFALRCGSKLVTEGDPRGKVLKYCGEPDSVQVRSVYRAGLPRRQLSRRTGDVYRERELLYADRAYVEIVVEEWTYNFGPRRLMRVVRFENGIVASITRLGYGYR